MAIYSADREELNEQIRYYQDVITAYNTRTANATKIAGHASTIVAESTSTNPLFKIIDQSRTNQMIEKIKTFWEDLVQADRNAQNGLDDVQKGIHSINERVHSFTDLLGNNGSNLPNLKPTQLYETMWLDETLIANIMNKLDAGVELTSSEQDLLYHYFQNEFLTSADIEEIETTASYINETDIDQLKDRLNEEVIISEEALTEEIAMIQAYLYLGSKRPGEGSVKRIKRERLGSYLWLLQNFMLELDDDVFMRVDNLKFEHFTEGKKGYFIQSALETVPYDHKGLLSEEEFQRRYFESRPTERKKLSVIESVYYSGSNSSDHYHYIEKNQLEDMESNYDKQFLLKNISQKVISLIGKRNVLGFIATSINEADKLREHNASSKENEDTILIKNLVSNAGILKMGFNIYNHLYTEFPSEQLNATLYPTDSTYEIFDRWKIVSMINNQIPYPEDLILSQKWDEVGDELLDLGDWLENDYPDLEEYITQGVLTNKTVEEVSNGK